MVGGQPHPESRRLVEVMLDSQLQGKPCLDQMAPELATLVIEQNEGVTRELVALGQRTGLTFLPVTPEGGMPTVPHSKTVSWTSACTSMLMEKSVERCLSHPRQTVIGNSCTAVRSKSSITQRLLSIYLATSARVISADFCVLAPCSSSAAL